MNRARTLEFGAAVGVLLMCCAVHIRGEVFTSMADLEKVLAAEQQVAHDIRNYVEQERLRLAKLTRAADDLEAHATEALQDSERHLANPVNSFLLVKKLSIGWKAIVSELLTSIASNEWLEKIHQGASSFPDEHDLTGAAFGLARLQDTYQLNTSDLASGRCSSKVTPGVTPFTAEDCFDLGKAVYFKRDYYHAILWMEEALRRLDNESPKTADKASILDFLSYSHSTFGNIRVALNLTNEWLQLEPSHARAIQNRQYYLEVIERFNTHRPDQNSTRPIIDATPARSRDEYQSSSQYQDYERLCRGEETHERPFKHQLSCRHRQHHPMFYIRPLKEELLNMNPDLWVFHDVLTDNEISIIKNMSLPKLQRSGVFKKAEKDTGFSQSRTSKTAWHGDWENPAIARISARAAAATNLTLESVEHLQVLNYGIGGHYEPHYDFSRPGEGNTFEEWKRNRIATFICYLTDLEAGGHTAYPRMGTFVTPRKGSCAMWFNLKKNGEGDYDTIHAACPVLQGYKWVANKWFHETGQEFTRPCSLSRNE